MPVLAFRYRWLDAIGKLIVAVLLMNAPFAFNLATSTILGTADTPISLAGLNSGSSMLTYSGNSTIEVIKRYSELVAHSFVILASFGAFAFVRGILMLKSVAEAAANVAPTGRRWCSWWQASCSATRKRPPALP